MAETTIILGTGIIGLSTAHYLSLTQTASTIHLVEPSPTLFASASGYAGGFLAKDWFSTSVAALGRLSFEEHKELAESEGGREKWGYMCSRAVSYTAGKKGRARGGRVDDWLQQDSSRAEAAAGGGASVTEVVDEDGGTPRWLQRGEGDEVESISEDGSTAQVDPLQLCQFLLKSCLERGVQLHHPARAVSVDKDMHDELSAIRILNTDTHTITDMPCTKILIASGAWSPLVFSNIFPSSKHRLPISSLAGHSLVVRSPRWKKEHEQRGCHAVFTTDESGYSPEIFSRIGGEIYITGLNSSALQLPGLATEAQINNHSIATLKKAAQRLLGLEGEDLEIVREGLCFRPVTKMGTPILGRISDERLGYLRTRGGKEGGVWIAAGHGPWGISLSLGTGKVMAEMIQGKATSVDVSGLGL